MEEFRLCVDEGVQKRRFLAGMLCAEGGYEIEWCVRGIEEGKGDLMLARGWLERNARKRGE
jgi:hypothetical protein